MKELEQYVIEKYINKIIKEENDKKYVLEEDLEKLKLSVIELDFIENLLKKYSITIRKEEIKKEDRSKLVKDYSYGDVKELNRNKIDTPVMAILNYDEDGNLIYEDYKKLDEFLDNEFIPEHVMMKYRLDREIDDYVYYPSIQLNKIVALQFSEMEVEHIIKYLNKDGIHVGGVNSSLDGEFDDYDYVRTYKNGKLLNSQLSSDDILDKFKIYKKNPTLGLRTELIEDNIRLAKFVAYKVAVSKNIDIEELFTYAYEGLIEAVDGFDPGLGYKFSTYAYPTIRGYILKGIPDILGYDLNDYYEKILPVLKVVEQYNGTTIRENPELVDDVVDLLIASCHYPVERAEDIGNMLLFINAESLNKHLENDRDNECSDFEERYLIEDNLLYKELTKDLIDEKISDVLLTLTPKEKDIIVTHFGLDGTEPKTKYEACKLCGMSLSQFHAKEGKALRKLRHPSRSRELRGLYELYDEYNYEPNPMNDQQYYRKLVRKREREKRRW